MAIRVHRAYFTDTDDRRRSFSSRSLGHPQAEHGQDDERQHDFPHAHDVPPPPCGPQQPSKNMLLVGVAANLRERCRGRAVQPVGRIIRLPVDEPHAQT